MEFSVHSCVVEALCFELSQMKITYSKKYTTQTDAIVCIFGREDAVAVFEQAKKVALDNFYSIVLE